MTSSVGGSSIDAHGGELVNLLCEGQELERVMKLAAQTPHTWEVRHRQICDLELLLNGGFSPLRGFMNEEDYDSVVSELRVKSLDNIVFPMPITLDVDAAFAESVQVGQVVALRDNDKRLLAVLHVESKWKPNKAVEAEKVFGSADDELHPSVHYLLNTAGEWYLGGRIEGAALPVHYDYAELRRTPAELRALLKKMAWTRTVGFQTRNPMHRSHREVTMRAARQAHANVLVHPVVGMTKPGDVDHFTRVRCYIELMKTYPVGMALLSLLPLAMRMAGPREALWHAIIRQNYGATHFCVGRDHAGPGKNRDGNDFYGTYDAHALCKKYASEVKISFLFFNSFYYVEERGEYCTEEEAAGLTTRAISGTELRRRLYRGIAIPEWFSFPSVVKILRQTYPPREQQGFCVFLTGFSGAGKSTLASALVIALQEDGRRPVTLLDGDIIRTHLSSELGFSRRDRDINIRRVGYVAGVAVRNGGAVVSACIAPYRTARDEARELVAKNGGFFEVHVATPIEVCEGRDPKGLYKRVRAGEITGFTGIDDPYEPPINPEIIIDTSKVSVRQAVHMIFLALESEGYISAF